VVVATCGRVPVGVSFSRVIAKWNSWASFLELPQVAPEAGLAPGDMAAESNRHAPANLFAKLLLPDLSNFPAGHEQKVINMSKCLIRQRKNQGHPG